MSLLLNTIRAFPRGRTTEELLVLLGAAFSHDKRLATHGELEALFRDGVITKGYDGRWRAQSQSFECKNERVSPSSTVGSESIGDVLHAAYASFSSGPGNVEFPEPINESSESPDPKALLKYWRSALRADPRGATTQVRDKHGIEWNLITGRGLFGPDEGQKISISVGLEAINPSFLEAVVRREGHENSLALGWPIMVGRSNGVPVFQPVGMFVASWDRDGGKLILTIDSDDVLVNPDWVRGAARASGWRRDDLEDFFSTHDGLGLRTHDFVEKVRTAVASQIRSRVTGANLSTQLDASVQGIFDAAAIFLPTDSSFTAGAARDLDEIATWPKDQLSRTSLGSVLGLNAQESLDDCVPAIDAGSLNKEQLRAVRSACSAPLTVVTGPPGTGKSQAIVSMAASVLIHGGSVLVASKNHQALDAVEDRLGSLAPNVPFAVRTLNPNEEADMGFTDALKKLIDSENVTRSASVDSLALDQLKRDAYARSEAVDAIDQISQLECDISDILERIQVREDKGRTYATGTETPIPQQHQLFRLISWFKGLIIKSSVDTSASNDLSLGHGMDLRELQNALATKRFERDALGIPDDPISLGEKIQEAAEKILHRILSIRTHLPEDRRREIAERYDDWVFNDGRGHLPNTLSQEVVSYRPLWLASILGTPRRIPLVDALFDLVIFDEASQCDIATAVPLLARAKRAVVVGDDRQLSFIPQLGQAQDRNLMQAQGLPVGKIGRYAQSRRSLFDLASRVSVAENRITLTQQYRSAGPIVDYISENFYGNKLKAAYDPKRLIVPKGVRPGLAWEHVSAPAIAQMGNVNPSEVNAIVRHLGKLINEDQYVGSIGVITPFRAQVAAIEDAVACVLDEPKRIACELKVGTVDGFQGQERDLIMFSPCVGPRSPHSGLSFFQRDTRRLNVAISRARAVAMIFGDLEFARSGKSRALAKLAARATEARTKRGEGVFDSDWERKVYYALKARGLNPQPQHEIAGRRLDFALFGVNGVMLDLEVDGRTWHESPDGRRKTSDLWRDHQLKSMGWRVRRFWVDELSRDMEGCLDRVEQDLS